MNITNITKNDFAYILMVLVLTALAAVVVGSPNPTYSVYSAIGLVGIALVMAIFIRPSLGANILILAIFTNISRQFTDRGYPSIIKILVLVVSTALLVHFVLTERTSGSRPRTSRIETFLFLFFFATALSYIVAANQERALEAILDLGKDIVIIFCILFALQNMFVWKQAAWIIILTTAFLSLLGLYQIVTRNFSQTFFGLAYVHLEEVFSGSTTPRLAGPINEPNIWGQIVVAVIPLVFSRVVNESNRRLKFLSLGILGLLLVEVLNTYSRGAYLALVVIAFLIMLERRQNPMVPVIGAGLFIIVLAAQTSTYFERFRTLSFLSPTEEYGTYQESSFLSRSSEMLTGLEMFEANPFLGVGAGNYPNSYQEYAARVGIEQRTGEREPHSLYVQLLAETGLTGTLLFAGFTYFLMTALLKAKKEIVDSTVHASWRPWLNAIQMSVIGYLVTSIFLHGAYLRYFWIFVALAISAIQLTYDSLTRPEASPSRITN